MPAISASRPRIVDADGHVLEHPTAMLEYMPERFKKRCFHVETDAKGVEWCFYDDLKMYANRMALAGAGGMTLEERQRALKGEMRYSDIRSGAFDPARRLVEMAQDDIEQAVVYPTQFLGISSRPDLDFAEAKERLDLTENQVVTVASLIEKEAANPEEKPLIASVIYNRMRKDTPLQIDATIQYALKRPKASLSLTDLKVDSPYNTYENKGLPPGPICSPGRESLLAALNPANTDYLYYVLEANGEKHFFAKNYDDFLRAKAER